MSRIGKLGGSSESYGMTPENLKSFKRESVDMFSLEQMKACKKMLRELAQVNAERPVLFSASENPLEPASEEIIDQTLQSMTSSQRDQLANFCKSYLEAARFDHKIEELLRELARKDLSPDKRATRIFEIISSQKQ